MAKIDVSKLELTEKKTTERKAQEPLSADHPVVEALQALNDAERRISYRGFAALCVAAGEHQGGFNPRLFGLLNRMPNQLDALVCRPAVLCAPFGFDRSTADRLW